jgi:LuxR family maltose regulon positive regulatory protein
LIEEIAEIEWDRARESRLLQWVKKLPDEQIETNPTLCIFYARELFNNGYPEDAEAKLQAAEQILESTSISDVNQGKLQGRIAVIRAYICARTGDISRTIHCSNQALKLLPQKDLMWRSVAATTLGIGYGWSGAGDLVKAQQAYSEAMKISQAAGNIFYNIFAGIGLMAVMQLRCQFKKARDICQHLLRLADENGLSETELTGSLYANLGMILCEWNDLDEGIRLINKGIDLNKQGRDPVILASCRINLLRALVYRMDFVGAFGVFEKLNESTREFSLPPWITNMIAAINVHIWLANGNLSAVAQWAKEKGLSVENKLTNLREPEHTALAHFLIAQGQLDDADRFLQRLIENATAGDRGIMMIEMRLMRALIFKAKQDTAAAMAELKLALTLAEPGGPLMMFVSKGKPVAELLEEILAVKKRDHDATKASFSLSYVRKILSVFKAGTPPKIEGLMDPISERELEVLYLIAAGLSNREIAEKLFISLNTVKTHTKSINSKLDVNSRIKAVARAKEIGLL